MIMISSRDLHSEMGEPNNELHCQRVCCCYYPVADWKINISNTAAYKKNVPNRWLNISISCICIFIYIYFFFFKRWYSRQEFSREGIQSKPVLID